ncbi:hypothetical protein [Xylanibacillus composti]|uniref:hypothetical protein n=1 Tax=Xylanibacillus composti TaxID=1572762 RepID=UPI001BD19CE3|nr:hypothetical protein [Xylanibacillus composti]
MITILFWPFMIASVVLSILGIWIKSHRLFYASAICIIPMSIYLAGWPLFRIWGLLFPLFYVGAAISMKKDRRSLSLLACLPVYFVIGWLAFIVLNQ